MNKTKIAFFDAKSYDMEFFNKHNEEHKARIKYFEYKLDEDTVELAKNYDVVCIFVNDTVNERVISKLREYGVGLIALRCAGYNNVDLKALGSGVKAVRVPDYSPYAVAEHAIALMMTLNRKCHRAYFRTRENNFAIKGLLGFDMHGKTVGVIGTGKIGKVTIDILKGYGVNILAYDPYPNFDYAKEKGFLYVDLDRLYTESNIITLHCPLTKETMHIINRDSISKMKHGVMIINTSRGSLIDTVELLEALKSGKIGYAGLDVYEEEADYFFEDNSDEIIKDDVLSRLLTLPNVLITSHQAFFTEEALDSIAHVTLENIRKHRAGEELENEVR
ncbi:MAG TPA: hydroxyacid dehydrogenase [Clostridiales bacterium]|nr:MAG: hydroxyacid dehydrogenase [Clostridiales bacterium GWD2_32_59]HAN09989.1 hydroxyacid dehydrogenase [Clostridiales bacterium]